MQIIGSVAFLIPLTNLHKEESCSAVHVDSLGNRGTDKALGGHQRFGLEFKWPHTSLFEGPVLPLVYPLSHGSGFRENAENAVLASEVTPTRKLTGEGQPGLGGEPDHASHNSEI